MCLKFVTFKRPLNSSWSHNTGTAVIVYGNVTIAFPSLQLIISYIRADNRKQITSILGKAAGFVQVIGFVSKRVPYCIVYEDMNAGNLGNFLSQLRRGPVPHWYLSLLTNLWADKYAPRVSDDLLTISTQVTQAMRFLEQKRVLHRSIGTSKVLLLARPKSFLAKV